MKISLISAVAQNGVIGCTNPQGKPDLPWHLPDDFAFFKKKTSHHPIIMGRKSLEALGKPLPNRTNIVITRNPEFTAAGVTVVHTLDNALAQARTVNQEEIFVIGGAEIYAMALPIATTLYLTEIHQTYEGDAYFPAFDRSEWKEVSRKPHPADERHEAGFDFVEYEKQVK
ncbi:dihydrofolate reductase [Spirosoma taeanense]|uniref:Dihydrofolate reductase n=1 Tax=Spirosoma taeanense TaxID=2735870 RepID=A0A6M5Y5R0_9BACT|nr:dihydrofolate reductase [Spirosoma taeanense]QJW88804.1 dihydrofolate reductase [Spirosoma taeanense]